MTDNTGQTLDTLREEYIIRFRILHRDLDRLYIQRRKVPTVERRQRAEAAIAAKRAELLALRREAWETAGVWL